MQRVGDAREPDLLLREALQVHGGLGDTCPTAFEGLKPLAQQRHDPYGHAAPARHEAHALRRSHGEEVAELLDLQGHPGACEQPQITAQRLGRGL